MDFKEISSKKTYKQIIDQIIGMIENGDIKSGDRLPGERDLAVKLCTSRSSIREAFRTLEILGILEVRHGGGTYVKSFDIAPFINTIAPLFLSKRSNISDLIDFRILLEGEAVKAAALSHDDATIEAMTKSLASMAGNDPVLNEQADLDFHRTIFAATDSKAFIFAGECLSNIFYASIHMNRTSLMQFPEMTVRWANEHARILESVSAGDAVKAYEALRDHLKGVCSYLTKELSDENNRLY